MAYSVDSMRAKATNDTIIMQHTIRLSKFDSQTVIFLKDAAREFESAGGDRLAKRALWRSNDDQYSMITPSGVFQGMIERGEFVANNTAIRIKLIVRGVAHVPLWWFTCDEFINRNHSLMGPFFSHNRSQGDRCKQDGLPNNQREIGWLQNHGERTNVANSLLECFFKL